MKMASWLIDLISKKTNCTCSTLFVFPLPLFCTTTTLFCTTKASNFLVTHYFYGRIVVDALTQSLFPVFMFAFIFHCRSFSPCWPLVFLIFSPPLGISRFFFLRNSSPLKKTRLGCCFFLSKSPGGHVISFQLHLGCHTCWLSYFTLVCLWCGRTVARSSLLGHVITKFSRMGGGANTAKITVNVWDFAPPGNAITPLQSAIILDLT